MKPGPGDVSLAAVFWMPSKKRLRGKLLETRLGCAQATHLRHILREDWTISAWPVNYLTGVWIVKIESSLQEMAIWEAILVGHLIPRSSFSSAVSFLCIWGGRDQNRKRFNQENTCIFVHFEALTAWPRHCPCDFSGTDNRQQQTDNNLFFLSFSESRLIRPLRSQFDRLHGLNLTRLPKSPTVFLRIHVRENIQTKGLERGYGYATLNRF